MSLSSDMLKSRRSYVVVKIKSLVCNAVENRLNQAGFQQVESPGGRSGGSVIDRLGQECCPGGRQSFLDRLSGDLGRL